MLARLAPLEAPRKNPCHASPSASGVCCQPLALLGLQMRHSNLCVHHHVTFCVRLCPNFPLQIRTLVALDSGPALIRCDLILPWLPLQRPFQIGHVYKFWVDMEFWGDINQFRTSILMRPQVLYTCLINSIYILNSF